MDNQQLINNAYEVKFILQDSLKEVIDYIESLKVISDEELKSLRFEKNKQGENIYYSKKNHNFSFPSADYGRVIFNRSKDGSLNNCLDLTVKNKEELLTLFRQLNLL